MNNAAHKRRRWRAWGRYIDHICRFSNPTATRGMLRAHNARARDIQRRQRAAIIRALRNLPGVNAETARRMYDNQVVPQLRVAGMQARGVNAQVAFVNSNPMADGSLIVCDGCGTQGISPLPPPPGYGVLCPDCQRGLRA